MAESKPILNIRRRKQLLDLMAESGWDLVLLYGHSWRKDFFRSLLNFNFFGPHAVAALHRSGDVSVMVSDPWDRELLDGQVDAKVSWAPDFAAGLERMAGNFSNAKTAIAPLEMMEQRFTDIVNRTTGRDPVSATPAVELLRRFKSPEEIEIVKQAAHLADIGFQHFVDAIHVGMAEYELAAEVEAFLKFHGAEDNFMIMASGTTDVFGMKPPTKRRFQEGDNVTTELSPQINGYYAQICRTVVLGEPSPEQQRSFAIFLEAQQASQRFIRPGVNVSEVARVQNDVFRREGYGEYTSSKYTRVRGHNLGLHVDENPWVLENVDCMVDKGMVLILHPNTYLPLTGYMVYGDALVIDDNGAVCLAETEKKLFFKEV